jgi:ATP-dependent Clp protease ATP-binding subunit ClpC
MLERFTERAWRVVVLAIEEARSRRHEAVSPAHLLMGFLRDGDSSAVHMLEQLHVRPEALLAELERVLSEIPGSATGGDPIFSPDLKAVLAIALGVKRPRAVNTNLLLLALAAEHSPIGEILRTAGADRRLMPLSGFGKPVNKEDVSFVATSTWLLTL